MEEPCGAVIKLCTGNMNLQYIFLKTYKHVIKENSVLTVLIKMQWLLPLLIEYDSSTIVPLITSTVGTSLGWYAL